MTAGKERSPAPQLVDIDRLMDIMERREIDAVVASSHQNLYYLSSLNASCSEIGRAAAICCRDSRHAPDHPILVMPEYYTGALARLGGWIKDVRPYRSMISPLDRAAQKSDLDRFVPQTVDNAPWIATARDAYAETMIDSLNSAFTDLKLSGKRVAFDDARLGMRMLDDIDRLADGFGLLMSARSVKSPVEIDMLRKATAINQSAIETTIERWQPGMTWFDLTIPTTLRTEAGGFVHDPGALVLASPRGSVLRVHRGIRRLRDRAWYADHVRLSRHERPLLLGWRQNLDCRRTTRRHDDTRSRRNQERHVGDS